MDAKELSACPSLETYELLAEDLFNACTSDDTEPLRRIADFFRLGRHPAADELRSYVRQRLRALRKSEEPGAEIDLAGARDFVAASHAFEGWVAFCEFIAAMNRDGSSVARFEAAVDAVIDGDVAKLEALLREHSGLIHERSARLHHATLLHYVSANGVEDFRQRTPPNAAEVAALLLNAGAEADATLADGTSTTLGLVASSIHPANAGVQIFLMDLLLERDASIEGVPGGWYPLIAALHNGRPEAAAYLARRGAQLDLEGAAGVGRLDVVKSFVNPDGSVNPPATRAQMELGFLWACEYGHDDVIAYLLDAGLDPGTQVGGMNGLHWAMVGCRASTVRLLLDRHAPIEAKNSYGGTALGCATWAVMNSGPAGRWPDTETHWVEIIQMLLDAGANIAEADYPTGNSEVDAVLRKAFAAYRPKICSPVSRTLPVADLARSVAYYRDALGFEIRSEDGGASAAVAEAIHGPARIRLSAEGNRQPSKPAVVFFELSDVAATREMIASRGGSPSELARVNWIKMAVFQISDPDGHTLWFAQSYAEADQPREHGQLLTIMPELPLGDVAAGIEYYRDVLGFSVNYAQHNLGVMDRDEIRVLLIGRTEKHRGIGSCYVYVADADALHAELLTKGANVQGEPVSYPWGLREFQILDLEGNRIKFGQPFE